MKIEIIEKTNEMKSRFLVLEKTNKINKLLTKLIKQKREDTNYQYQA